MNKNFKIGDTVAVINDTVHGIIKKIQISGICITDQDGFDRVYQPEELVVYNKTSILEQGKIILKDVSKNTERKTAVKNIIDLHANHKTTSKNVLERQLRVFKNKLDQAIQKQQKSIIFIHGIGEGILRKEIEKILKQRKISYGDAPYKYYGQGAIEIFLK